MLRLDGVWKSYRVRGRDKEVLRGVDATVRKGDAIGILGRNGAGKSTLMRLIAGVEHPNAGRIHREMSISWPLGYGGALHSNLSGADNVRFVARIYGRPVDWTLGFCEEFAELGEHMRMPVRTYSSGMQSRLALALSLAVDFDCYLVDEMVAAGDARFAGRGREELMARRGRAALILVSHSEELVRNFCTSAAVLQDGKLHFHEDLDQAFAAYRAL
ncbi:ABC transporter ATP-binding protein [Sabulicella glaciei]|uniref:ABC transporter ATP-binding protein n=1 Tax=Sabulicella glaciei TaxID=2984948 RepID=A0ABT3NUP3_9PROT|nr:ABC transporter ATP-binding protein [Roseococcus sp. MDT2-1-1]MCW8085873.1 ABC transporter ATP-binding protein [Roseococcus sp. MDT2-1-1]